MLILMFYCRLQLFFQKASHFEVLHDHSSYLATSPFSVVFRRRPEGHLGGSTRNAGTWGNWLHHRGWLLPVPFRHGEVSLVQHVQWGEYVMYATLLYLDHVDLYIYICDHITSISSCGSSKPTTIRMWTCSSCSSRGPRWHRRKKHDRRYPESPCWSEGSLWTCKHRCLLPFKMPKIVNWGYVSSKGQKTK